MILEQCTDILISSTIVTISSSRMCPSEFGLVAFESRIIVVDSLQASNFSWGMTIYKSFTIDIRNTKIESLEC